MSALRFLALGTSRATDPCAYFLARYIRDPQGLRKWPQGRMPGFTKAVLSEQELAALIEYLRHMAGHKLAQSAP